MKTTRIMAIAALIVTTGLALHVGEAQQVELDASISSGTT